MRIRQSTIIIFLCALVALFVLISWKRSSPLSSRSDGAGTAKRVAAAADLDLFTNFNLMLDSKAGTRKPADEAQHAAASPSNAGKPAAVNSNALDRPNAVSGTRSSSSPARNTSDKLVRAAVAISEERGLVLFTVINDAYFDLAANWLCNTAPLGDVHRHVLFLATDEATGERLRATWPDVTVVSLNGTGGLSGTQEYSKAGYVRLMVERTRLIQRLVQAGVRLLLFEVDFVWLADPLPTILAHSLQSRADVVATKIYGVKLVCGCFLLLNPTPLTRGLWTRLTERMEELYSRVALKGKNDAVSEGTNDQTFLSDLVNRKYGGVQVSLLPEALFPDGQWYSLAKLRAVRPAPLVIHNNWIIGNPAKIKRAKEFGHWFLDDSSTRSRVVCNATALRDLVSSQPAPQAT